MVYTSKQVVEKIDGLNSTRTLRRWTELAKVLCSIEFSYDYMNVGHKNTHIRYLAYTETDLQKFQFVVKHKAKLGLNEAIQQAFRNEQQLTLASLDERLVQLIEKINKILDFQSEKITLLEKQKISLSQENYRLTKRLEQVEQAIESKSELKHYWRERASP
ncbi:putative nuclease with TOPRIM domain [Enterococcus sp. PF1-24]|uniref:hypothetical protein n=1 Tax=unclassified Enterococcus TaxID=2608891 RepID=UPI002474F2C5|nr:MULTISPECIES: hypothetical protein [unclassified Enterococcus]MDH6363470.1 putative nuclease with TOPRIM domain [Enterococcus sp. PFB1-1]MDH6400564.1 putative nuclease with TOPRIM domain [Enterococcus sp. PF1-24]